MKDLTKYFIDLSKCSEEQRKSLPQILEKAGETLGDQIDFEGDDLSYWTNFHKPDYATYWTCGTSNSTPGKTELTYPEFIKLFEGRESDGWIKIESEADLPKEKGDYFVFTIDKNIETIYVDGDISVMEHTSQSWIRNFTHYQPIIKPLPPKF